LGFISWRIENGKSKFSDPSKAWMGTPF